MNKELILWSLLVISSVATTHVHKKQDNYRTKRESFIDLNEVPDLVFGLANSVRRGFNNVVHQGNNLRQRMFGFGSSFMNSAHRNNYGKWKPILSPKPQPGSLYNNVVQNGGGISESYGAPYAPQYSSPPSYKQPQNPPPTVPTNYQPSGNGGTLNINFDDCDCHFGNSDSFKPLPSGFDANIDTYGKPVAKPIIESRPTITTSSLPSSSSSYSVPSLPSSSSTFTSSVVNQPSGTTYTKPIVQTFSSFQNPVQSNTFSSQQPSITHSSSSSSILNSNTGVQPTSNTFTSFPSSVGSTYTITNQPNSNVVVSNPVTFSSSSQFTGGNNNPFTLSSSTSSGSTFTFPESNGIIFSSTSSSKPISNGNKIISSIQPVGNTFSSSPFTTTSTKIISSDPIYTPPQSVDSSPAPQSVNEIGHDLSEHKKSFINLDEEVIKRVLANTLYYKDLKSFKKYHKGRKIHKELIDSRRRR